VGVHGDPSLEGQLMSVQEECSIEAAVAFAQRRRYAVVSLAGPRATLVYGASIWTSWP
jgi:hypothetical protein